MSGGTERDLSPATRAWLRLGVRRREPVPSVRPHAPLEGARVGVVSTGGAVAPGQEPFSTGKRGDPSFRSIPSAADLAEVRWSHPHYDTSLAAQDPEVVFPLRTLRRLAGEGRIGRLAPTAVSMMGYAPLTRTLERETAPAIGELMQGEGVDAALLCPA